MVGSQQTELFFLADDLGRWGQGGLFLPLFFLADDSGRWGQGGLFLPVFFLADDSGRWGQGGLFSALSRRSLQPETQYELASKMKGIYFIFCSMFTLRVGVGKGIHCSNTLSFVFSIFCVCSTAVAVRDVAVTTLFKRTMHSILETVCQFWSMAT